MKSEGLDYWDWVHLYLWKSCTELKDAYPGARFWLLSKKAEQPYTNVQFQKGDFLVFGKETFGLPETLLSENPEFAIRIPMVNENVRSLNLSSSVAVVLYEALRQTGQLK